MSQSSDTHWSLFLPASSSFVSPLHGEGQERRKEGGSAIVW